MHAERVLRPSLVAGLVLAVLSLLALQTVELVGTAERRMGFGCEAGPFGCAITSVYPGLPADRAGMKKGDQILAVNGAPATTYSEYMHLALGFKRGSPIEVSVLREGRELTLSAVPGVPPRWTGLILGALGALCYLVLALLILTHWRRDHRTRLLAAFTSAMAIELAMPLQVVGRPVTATILVCLYYLLTGLELSLELHLVSLIPQKHPWAVRQRWVIPLFYVVGLAVGLLCSIAHLADAYWQTRLLPWGADANGSLISHVILPFWAVTMTVILIQQIRWAPGKLGRSQASLVLAGTLPWTLYVLSTAVYNRLGGELPLWSTSLEALVLLASPLAFLVAIARYRLFDIEVMAHRTLVYTALTGALLLAFYGALGAGSALFSHLLDHNAPIWAVSFATLILGLLFSPLRQVVEGWIERRFFPERQELRQRLLTLAGELSAHGKLPKMAQYLIGQMTEIFASRTAGILIAAPETRLLSLLGSTDREPETSTLILPGDPAVELLIRSARAVPAGPLLSRSAPLARCLGGIGEQGLLVPLLIQDRLVGVLGVGRQIDGRPYSTEECDLLNLVAHHLAIVFENARLFESATHEGLTGLLRREAVLEQLDRELDRAARYHRPLTVAMADLDHFKEVNDRYGHLAGDMLLKRVARVLGSSVRSTDSIGRYGGEEFLLILPETELGGAAAVAEKIRDRVQQASVPMEDGTPAQVTISIGIATLEEIAAQQEGKVTARDLIAAADRSLYTAKRAGRNRIHPLVRVVA